MDQFEVSSQIDETSETRDESAGGGGGGAHRPRGEADL